MRIQLGAIVLGLGLGAGALAVEDYTKARAEMLALIERDVQETAVHLGKSALDPRVLDVMRVVPRHEFVPRAERKNAYANRPLPIGHGQTISQPYIVALMTDLLAVEPGDTVLEVGTGSGYQAAVLSPLVARVFSIEIVPQLGERARADLARVGYSNVEVRIGDGYFGWEEHAPFDGIVVTAAASHVPPPLIRQLKPGGRMVIPVGSRFMVQELLLVEKSEAGEVTTRQILPVAFVPLTGGH
ncbi:MAG: protein-L-isoaspartate(D-aspartate) O-methyltransferase [Thiotrichales bacterium]